MNNREIDIRWAQSWLDRQVSRRCQKRLGKEIKEQGPTGRYNHPDGGQARISNIAVSLQMHFHDMLVVNVQKDRTISGPKLSLEKTR